MSIIKLALAQLRCNLFDKANNLHRVLETIKYASDSGADYVLFPELYLTGYSLNAEVSHLSEPLNGPSVRNIQQSARAYGVGVIIGIPEKSHNQIFNTAVFIGNKGEIIGYYRKTHLYAYEKNFFSPGDKCPVFMTAHGKIGLMITYDMEFPEVARLLAIKGAQLVLILAANMVPYQNYQSIFLRSRAMENHIFIAATNKVGLENDTVFFGESEVIHPTGKSLYKSCNNEDLAVVEINTNETYSSMGLLNYLTNRRPELYRNEGI